MNFEEGTAAAGEELRLDELQEAATTETFLQRNFRPSHCVTVHAHSTVLLHTPPATHDVADYPPTVVREGNTSRGEWGNLGRERFIEPAQALPPQCSWTVVLFSLIWELEVGGVGAGRQTAD